MREKPELKYEAAKKRVTANWEFYKHRFVNKTNEELEKLRDSYFDIPEQFSANPFTPDCENVKAQYNNGVSILSEHIKLEALKVAFAIVEELRRRGLNG